MTMLREAYELIKDEDHWCTDNIALNKEGKQTWAKNPEADRWCALGALEKVDMNLGALNREEHAQAWQSLTDQAFVLFGLHSIVNVNNDLGHQAVLQCYEKAIVEVEGSL